MKTTFDPVPGMLVRCINDQYRSALITSLIPKIPKRGTIYTVRDVLKNTDGEVAIRLAELVNPVLTLDAFNPVEPCFITDRFVPVDPRRLDVFHDRSQDVDTYINDLMTHDLETIFPYGL